jgi:hypothetical protein
MASGQLAYVLHCLRRLGAGPPEAAPTDADLLRRFVAGRDEDAFAALVARHGPIVYAVCRRLLRHAHDAEDAFQATFLVLARKAASIRRGQALAGAGWGLFACGARPAPAGCAAGGLPPEGNAKSRAGSPHGFIATPPPSEGRSPAAIGQAKSRVLARPSATSFPDSVTRRAIP